MTAEAGRLSEAEREALLRAWPWPSEAATTSKGFGTVVHAVERIVAEREAKARAEALRTAADRWTQGEWSNVMLPKPAPPAVPVIAYANRVGDWLRERADQEAAR